jgi:hypothetical protein
MVKLNWLIECLLNALKKKIEEAKSEWVELLNEILWA